MNIYRISCDKRVTIAAVVLEVLMVVACVLLGDAIAQQVLKIPTMLDNHISVTTAAIVVGVLQYLIVVTELIACHRDDRRGFTLPIVFLPGGIIVRYAFMAVLAVSVVLLKLLTYFVSVLLAFVFQICRVDRIINAGRLIDRIDRTLEPIEIGVNRIYNVLYFHKIRANTSVFTSIFSSLTT